MDNPHLCRQQTRKMGFCWGLLVMLGSVGYTWATGSKVVMADKDDVSESGEGHGQLVGLPVKGHAPCWLGGPPCGSHSCTFHARFVALSLLASLL